MTPYITQPVTDFLAYVSNLIPADKFKVFKTLFRYPVKTNEVTGVCFDKLSRIFDGRNPAFNYQFMNSEQRDDWEYYRQHVLEEPEIWSTKGWEYFKTEINSVLIVDLPKEQTNTMSQSQLPVIVSLTDSGDIFISYEDNVDLPISEPELIDTLSNLQNQSSDAGAQPLQVMINADQNNQYGAIMTLMATLQQAGIQKVGLLTGAPLPTPSL